MIENVSLTFKFIFLVYVIGLKVFESDIIKRIFQQDPTFCFRSFTAEGCSNRSLWERVPVPEYYTGPEPKTATLLFTPRNTRHPEFLHECGGQLPSNTNFNPRHKTEVFIHGYLDGACRSAWMRVSILWTIKILFNVILSLSRSKILGEGTVLEWICLLSTVLAPFYKMGIT